MLASGMLVLAFVVGSGVLDGWRPRRLTRVGFDRTVLCVALGIALLTPPLLLLAQVRMFALDIIGSIGWVTLAIWILTRRSSRWHWQKNGADLLMIVAAIVFTTIAFNARDEPWGAGRDPQVYAEFAVLLAETGGATARLAPRDPADAELLSAIGADKTVNRYLGVTRVARNGAIEEASYLPLGWPVWLAVAFAIGGYATLHGANAAVFAAGAILIYPVLRRASGSILALAAVVALLALPSSLWSAGISLSEPLAMLVWLASIALIAARRRTALRWMPLLLFTAANIRIDVLAMAPMLTAAVLADAALGISPAARSAARRFAAQMALAVVAAVAWYAAFQSVYLLDKLPYVLQIGAAALFLALASLAPISAYAVTKRALESRMTMLVAGALIAGLAAYAATVRPDLPSVSLIHNGTGLDGTRDFREESLRNLAAYVGWPLVVLACVGAVVAIRRFGNRGTSIAERVWVIVGLGFALVYLAAPLVSPDHPWAIRRMIPVVIPAVIMLSVLALRLLPGRSTLARASLAGAAIVGLACEAAAAHGLGSLKLRENEGMALALRTVGTATPDALIVADLPVGNLGIALALALNRSVVVVDVSRDEARAAVARWIAAKAQIGQPAWMLHGPQLSSRGIEAHAAGRWHFERRFLAGTTRPPATKIETGPVDVELSRIVGFDAAVTRKRFGGTPTWGFADRGFYPSTVTRWGTLRMTDGSAALEIPAKSLLGARGLAFDWFSWAPRGETRATHVRIGGREAWRGQLTPGVSTIYVPIPDIPASDSVHVEIDSESFDPRMLDPADRRHSVGVGLLGVRAVPESVGSIRGFNGGEFRSQLDITRPIPHIVRDVSEFTLKIHNTGSAPWPSLREHGADGAVKIGVRWYRGGATRELVVDHRSDLVLTMLPGDEDELTVPLVPTGLDGQALTPGIYEIEVGLVREPHGWFADHGDRTARFEAVVSP